MSDATAIAIAWLALAAHAAVAIAVRRRVTDLPLVLLVNLAAALCVLAYWGQRWYGYIAKGVTWYVSDQMLPLSRSSSACCREQRCLVDTTAHCRTG